MSELEINDMKNGSRNGMFCLVQISTIQAHRSFNFENQILTMACIRISREEARTARMERMERMERGREMENARIAGRKKGDRMEGN
jgi:hypothetical protein